MTSLQRKLLPPSVPSVWPSSRRIFLRRSAAALGGVALGAGFSGCAAPEKPVRIGSNVWPGYEFLYLARESGFFPGNLVRLVELASATACIQGLASGSLDGACLTLDETLTAIASGQSLKVIAVLDISHGADVVLARPGTNTLSDLRGKRIGLEQSAVGAVLLDAALRKGGLSPKDVSLVHLGIEAHVLAYTSGKVDALVTFEPVVTQLKAQKAVRLFDSAQIPGRILDVLAVRTEVAGMNPAALRSLVAGHFRAREFFDKFPQASHAMISRRLKVAPSEVPGTYLGLQLPDLQENRSWLAGEKSRLETSAVALQEVMLAAELLPKAFDVSRLADVRFLP